jgi:hypothetical protein
MEPPDLRPKSSAALKTRNLLIRRSEESRKEREMMASSYTGRTARPVLSCEDSDVPSMMYGNVTLTPAIREFGIK